MSYIVWLSFGLFASYEFGKIQVPNYTSGLFLPLVLSALLALGGLVALLIAVARSIAMRNFTTAILLEVSSIAGIVAGAWSADTGFDNIRGATGFGAIFYFLASMAITSISLLIVWIRRKARDDYQAPSSSQGNVLAKLTSSYKDGPVANTWLIIDGVVFIGMNIWYWIFSH